MFTANQQSAPIKSGDKMTFSFIGLNASGDTIIRKKADNRAPPFWGKNERTGKRGKAVKLAIFNAGDSKD